MPRSTKPVVGKPPTPSEAPPRKRRLIRLDTDARRAQLLAMGKQAFAARSYDEVSIDDLARKAKISKGLFYYYFPRKRDLYIAGLSEIARHLMITLANVPRDLGPREQVSAAVDAYLEHVADQRGAFVALMQGGIGSDPEIAAVIEKVRLAVIEELLSSPPLSAALRTRPLSRIAIRGWIGMVEATSIEWLGTQSVPRAAVRDLLVDSLFDVVTRVLDPIDAARFRQVR